MNNLLKIIRENKVLLFILVLSAYLRFSGVNPGFPTYHSDEGITYSAAVSMIKNENLDPLRYDYPSLVPLINYFLIKYLFIPVRWVGYYFEHLGQIIDGFIRVPLGDVEYKRIFNLEILGNRGVNALFWSRYITGLFGLGSVYLTYRAAKKLFNFRAGLLAALFVAINYRQVLNSHFGLPDIYNAFFLLLAFIGAINIYNKPNRNNYLLASIAAGLSLSVKFQVFSFLPLMLVHTCLALKRSTVKEKLRYLFRTEAFLVPTVSIFVFLLLNPYIFINWEETVAWLSSVSRKYRTGRMTFDFFPYSYLYHIGVGKVTSLMVILGIAIGLIRNRRKEILLLLSLMLPFFFVLTYYTGGGFYTRNFVTITPFLLIPAGYAAYSILKSKMKIVVIVGFALLTFLVRENLSKSLVVVQAYSQEWNVEIISEWILSNIDSESNVAAHSSVPLPPGIKRLAYDFKPAFSIMEFEEMGADYAVMSMDWATDHFYGWMTQNTKKSLEYWDKPIGLLEMTYPAMAIREFTDYAIFSVLNPWEAPDSGFIVAQIPKLEVVGKTLKNNFDFETSDITWERYGSKTLLNNANGLLNIEAGSSQVSGWISSPIELEGDGYVVEGAIKSSNTSGLRDGYLFVEFYDSFENAVSQDSRLAVRLSRRAVKQNTFEKAVVKGLLPENAKFMRIGFQNFDQARTNSSLEYASYSSANIRYDDFPIETNAINLEDGVIFHNSHGNL